MSLPVADPIVPNPTVPTGQQWTIVHGPYRATVVEVGGGLRTFTRDGHDVLAGYAASERCTSARGQQLMPWPNRIRDGRYTFGGVDHQLPITEVPEHNAIHGLVRWATWEPVQLEDAALTVSVRLFPQPGWEHALLLTTSYVLDDSGLIVMTTARNTGMTEAPFGYGAHPYLSIGDAPVEQVRLRVPGHTWIESDERSLPRATRPVQGDAHDFRSEHEVGDLVLDTAYGNLERDADGMWRTRLAVPQGPSVELWADAAFPWVQVFTRLAHERRQGGGIAIEPMTCPADAFNSGEGLIRLQPGAEWTGTWGIAPR